MIYYVKVQGPKIELERKTAMSEIILNSGQEELIYQMTEWYHNYRNGLTTKQWFCYGGAAGTGKTTVLKEFINRIHLTPEQYKTCAYVGKAVLVLARHGLPACTIHKLIYHTFAELEEPDPENPYFRPKIKPRFVLREKLEDELELVCIDEYRMVDDNMIRNILSYGKPVIFMGDENQLPPIFGDSTIIKPDFYLTQPMRQSYDSNIILLANRILEGRRFELMDTPDAKVVDRIEFGQNLLDDYDIIITSKNKTREYFNKLIREELIGRTSELPTYNDKLICRQNDWSNEVNDIGLCNGMVGFVTGFDKSTVSKGFMKMSFKPEFMDAEYEDCKLDYKYFKCEPEERAKYGLSKYHKFEYGYAITTHLSQGSEYGRVLYIREPWGDNLMRKQLDYTAVTRARDSITVVRDLPSILEDRIAAKMWNK